MLFSFATLLVFQCLGEGVVLAFALPIPGPVAGMLLLFVALTASSRLLAAIEATGSELLRHLSLLFVPAGVGILVAASSLDGHWLAVALSLIGSTLLTLAVTALVMRATLARAPASVSPSQSPSTSASAPASASASGPAPAPAAASAQGDAPDA